jgi:hypothetical protein
MLLNGANREDVPGSYLEELRVQLWSLDRKIEQLAAEITTSKANNNQ